MNLKNTLRTVIIAVIFIGAFLVLRSSAPAPKDSPCKESMEGCCKKEEKGGGMIWENLPHQFFSSN